MTFARFLSRIAVPAGCVVALAGVAGCGGSTTGPSSSAPYSQVDLRVGTGTEAVAGNTLTVNYTGWLYDPTKPDFKGPIFDTSVTTTPFSFLLGGNPSQVIAGWDQGLTGMKIGGARRLVIPPSLAYGSVRNHSIPPYSTLIFDVELIDVQ